MATPVASASPVSCKNPTTVRDIVAACTVGAFEILLEALKALLCDDGFTIPSPSAAAALMTASSLLVILQTILHLLNLLTSLRWDSTKHFMLRLPVNSLLGRRKCGEISTIFAALTTSAHSGALSSCSHWKVKLPPYFIRQIFPPSYYYTFHNWSKHRLL